MKSLVKFSLIILLTGSLVSCGQKSINGVYETLQTEGGMYYFRYMEFFPNGTGNIIQTPYECSSGYLDYFGHGTAGFKYKLEHGTLMLDVDDGLKETFHLDATVDGGYLLTNSRESWKLKKSDLKTKPWYLGSVPRMMERAELKKHVDEFY